MTELQPQEISEAAPTDLKAEVVATLKTCYDPEIPIDIYELGLIYEVDVSDEAVVRITMTLTSPMCPVAEILPGEVQQKIRDLENVENATIDLVWEPAWEPSMMSEAARLQLGF